MLSFAKSASFLFAFLGVLFIPFSFDLFPYQINITHFLFGEVLQNIATTVFDLQQNYQEISSDSSALYILILILFGLSTILSFFLIRINLWNDNQQQIFHLLRIIICYYLAMQLFGYGIDKIFKNQFYLPEPNILYTPLGHLDKDILFWSTMGTSYAYNLFMGSIQLLAATLLILKRTRVLGLLLCCGIFVNIVAINFSFDISVKVYSMFLLSISLLALSSNLCSMYSFFVLNKLTLLDHKNKMFNLFRHSFIKLFLKVFAILIMLFEASFSPLTNGVINDDSAERPFLHGAYLVQSNSNSTSFFENGHANIEKFFIHRNGYLIFQDKNDVMTDYKLHINKNEFVLTDYSLRQQKLTYQYFPSDSILKLTYTHQGKEVELTGKSLDWQSLPIMRSHFHWTIDK